MIYLMMQKNGMGNQMFMYAFGRALQEMYAREHEREGIVLNPYRFYKGDDRDYIDERHVSLQHFVLTPDTVFLKTMEEMERCNRKKRKQILLTQGPVSVLRQKLMPKSTLGEEAYLKRSAKGIYELHEHRAYYETVLSKQKDKFVQGIFINHRYFDPIRDSLREAFEIKTPASPENEKMLGMIRQCNSVCLHIRRGDYLNPQWAKLNICDELYYQDAVVRMTRKLEDPVFFVFTNTHDDIAWIKANYRFMTVLEEKGYRVEYVDLSNPDYEELRLMRACRHFIICNSTFSWWAAYLSETADSVVFAPNRWDLSLPRDAGMNMPTWKAIDTGH